MDKLSAEGYDTDKDQKRLEIYQEYFPPREQHISLLELGVGAGGSLEMWRDWFINGTIVGIEKDVSRIKLPTTERIFCYIKHQENTRALREVSHLHAPGGWDIIIDDASHRGDLTRISFRGLFGHLKGGGLYIIEDWGTSYMDDPAYDGMPYTGENHLAGMVGFLKELIDNLAQGRISGFQEQSPFERIVFAPGLAIVRKA